MKPIVRALLLLVSTVIRSRLSLQRAAKESTISNLEGISE